MHPMALTWEIQSLSSIHRNFLTQAMGDYVFPSNILNFAQRKSGIWISGSGIGWILIATPASATHGWKLHDRKTKEQTYGHGWVPSGGQEMSSLRAEIGGLLGGMAAISYLLMVELSVTPAR